MHKHHRSVSFSEKLVVIEVSDPTGRASYPEVWIESDEEEDAQERNKVVGQAKKSKVGC